ncbi:MAG: hypothetical protein Q4A83_07740 [Bacillota bacterium]|nr:hypothetical protein [Bacillota bacterium]
MTFRKENLLFCQSLSVYSILFILSFTLAPLYGIKITLLFASVFGVLGTIDFNSYNEYVTINETGIECSQGEKQLWAYEWSAIAKLQRGSRYLQPSIEIYIYSLTGGPEEVVYTKNYFQLGRDAKKALAQYYKP